MSAVLHSCMLHTIHLPFDVREHYAYDVSQHVLSLKPFRSSMDYPRSVTYTPLFRHVSDLPGAGLPSRPHNNLIQAGCNTHTPIQRHSRSYQVTTYWGTLSCFTDPHRIQPLA